MIQQEKDIQSEKDQKPLDEGKLDALAVKEENKLSPAAVNEKS